MHVIRNGTDAVNSDVIGQDAIQSVHQIITSRLLHALSRRRRWKRFFRIKVRYHHRSMNAGICATGTRDCRLMTKQYGKGVLECLLHALSIGLYLPSVVGCAVVTKLDEVTQKALRLNCLLIFQALVHDHNGISEVNNTIVIHVCTFLVEVRLLLS